MPAATTASYCFGALHIFERVPPPRRVSTVTQLSPPPRNHVIFFSSFTTTACSHSHSAHPSTSQHMPTFLLVVHPPRHVFTVTVSAYPSTSQPLNVFSWSVVNCPQETETAAGQRTTASSSATLSLEAKQFFWHIVDFASHSEDGAR